MIYNNTCEGIFLSRPNRFVAMVEVDGKECVCHVKNTGRCRELLTPKARVVLEKSGSPNRKTLYDLVAVYKGGVLINMDSQAPNKVFGEWVRKSGFFGIPTLVKPECTYKNSRFDFYIEAEGKKIFAEIKGVTLEENQVVMFPDAPTERGIKHLAELADAQEHGYETYVFFIIQMEHCKYFTPNEKTHPEFANALRECTKKGVTAHALTCNVTPNSLDILDFAPIKL